MKFQFKSSNLKNIFLLIGSIVLGKGVVLICTPFITKLYDPYLFGILALILSFGNILAVFFSMRYELKFLSVEKDKRISLLKFLNTHVALLFVFAAIICCLLFFYFDFQKYYLLIPIIALLASLYEINRMYSVAFKEFKRIAVSEVFRGVNQGLVPLFAFLSALFVPVGLVVAELSALLSSLLSIAGRKRLTGFLKMGEYKKTLKGAYPEMLITGPAKIINVSTSEIIPIGIGFLFNNELLGLYFVSRKLMGVPLSFITKALGDVLNNSLSEIFLKSGAVATKKYLFKQFKLLIFAGVIFAVGVYFLIDFLIDLFLDDSYLKVSQIIKLSLIYYFGLLIVTPLSNFFNVIGRFSVNLLWDIIRFVFVLSSFLITWYFGFTFDTFVFVLSFCLFLGYLAFVMLLIFYKEN